MKVISRRSAGALGGLYLGSFRDDPARLAEFVDTVEPGVAKALKWVLMISTQFGCAVGCRMCDAGALGYGGNLDADEMLAQVRQVLADNPGLDAAVHPKLKIHFARMGEPSLNPEVLKALRNLAFELPGNGLLPSLSTVAPQTPAVAPFFENLLRLKDSLYGGGRFQLQFSVHSTDAALRRRIVPIRTWSLEEIAVYGERWVRPGDRKVTLNFAPSGGEDLDPAVLGRVFDPARFLIKLTPVNPTRAADASGATFVWSRPPAALQRVVGRLQARGFETIVSPSLPEEIQAETSCGQLWSSSLKDGADVALRNRRRQAECYLSSDNLEAKTAGWLEELGQGRGRELALEPGRSALVVVDLQDFFLGPGSRGFLPAGRVIMLRARRLVDAFRAAGRPVFFLRHAHEDPEKDGGLMTRWWRKACRVSDPESRVCAALGARDRETLLKQRYSGFTNPELEARLRAYGVSDLVFCGIRTNLCVESTVRDAFDLDFKTFVCADATAAATEALHLASLKGMADGFSKVLRTGDVEALLTVTVG